MSACPCITQFPKLLEVRCSGRIYHIVLLSLPLGITLAMTDITCRKLQFLESIRHMFVNRTACVHWLQDFPESTGCMLCILYSIRIHFIMGMQEPRMLHRSYGTVWVCIHGVPGFLVKWDYHVYIQNAPWNLPRQDFAECIGWCPKKLVYCSLNYIKKIEQNLKQDTDRWADTLIKFYCPRGETIRT